MNGKINVKFINKNRLNLTFFNKSCLAIYFREFERRK